MIVDHYSSIYDNHVILGDFIMDPNSPILISFTQYLNFFNIIKSSTCFKGNGTCIDLILTNKKYSLKHSSIFETGLSDHHHLIFLCKKQPLQKRNQNYKYRDYKISSLFTRIFQGKPE